MSDTTNNFRPEALFKLFNAILRLGLMKGSLRTSGKNLAFTQNFRGNIAS